MAKPNVKHLGLLTEQLQLIRIKSVLFMRKKKRNRVSQFWRSFRVTFKWKRLRLATFQQCAKRSGEAWSVVLTTLYRMSVSVAYPTHPNSNCEHQCKHGNEIPAKSQDIYWNKAQSAKKATLYDDSRLQLVRGSFGHRDSLKTPTQLQRDKRSKHRLS